MFKRAESITSRNKGREEMSKLLKLSKKAKKKFDYLIGREIYKYGKRDNPNDIEQNIFEGLIVFINSRVEMNNYDLITMQIIKKKKKKKIENKRVIKVITNQYNIIKLNSTAQKIKFVIEGITSTKYGIRESKQKDILKKIDLSESYEEEEYILADARNEYKRGTVCDPDSEISKELYCLIDKFLGTLDEEEKILFEKYFGEEMSYSDLIESKHTSDWKLRKLIKKTKKFFAEQLIA